MEASVAYPGYCVALSSHYEGSVSDFTIFQDRREIHAKMLAKHSNELSIEDNGERCETYQHSWAVLVDKGYQGAQTFCRTIQPKKKTRGSELNHEDIQRNKRVSSDRIIVENFFGRVNMLWKISASTFKWSLNSYDMISRITFALTNYHVSLMELREADFERYKQQLGKYFAQGVEKERARSVSQAAYRRRRRSRLNVERYTMRASRSYMSPNLSTRSFMSPPSSRSCDSPTFE